mgnify:CR=1 FL=1
MKRVASYSLFWCGRDEHAKLYTNGLKAICRAHHVLFPGWTWRIHHDGSIDNELMFAGHNAYRFSQDPWYKNGFVPSVKQLVERITTGW